MNRRHDFLALLAGTVLFIAAASPAPANIPTSLGQTGVVTGLPGGNRVEVDGRVYTIPSGSEAAQRIKELHVGDRVDFKLEGSDKVVKVNVHAR